MRMFLMFSATVWGCYGLWCWAMPETLTEVAGLVATTPTARTELRAMYGGLQTAFGLLAVAGLMRPALASGVTACLGASTLGLFGARMHGVAVDGGISEYTIGGLVFEFVGSAWAFWALSRENQS